MWNPLKGLRNLNPLKNINPLKPFAPIQNAHRTLADTIGNKAAGAMASTLPQTMQAKMIGAGQAPPPLPGGAPAPVDPGGAAGGNMTPDSSIMPVRGMRPGFGGAALPAPPPPAEGMAGGNMAEGGGLPALPARRGGFNPRKAGMMGGWGSM